MITIYGQMADSGWHGCFTKEEAARYGIAPCGMAEVGFGFSQKPTEEVVEAADPVPEWAVFAAAQAQVALDQRLEKALAAMPTLAYSQAELLALLRQHRLRRELAAGVDETPPTTRRFGRPATTPAAPTPVQAPALRKQRLA